MFSGGQHRNRLRDGEEKIIRSLITTASLGGLTFTEIRNKTGLSNPVISDYLKTLQKNQYIARSIDTRKYVACQKARDEIKKLTASQQIRDSSDHSSVPFIPLDDAARNGSSSIFLMPQFTSFQTKYSSSPFTKEKATIDWYLSIDDEHRGKIKDIKKNIDTALLGVTFFDQIGKVLSQGKGGNHARDFVKKSRAQMDFSASLLLVFNGKEIAEKIDWKQLLKNADIFEKQEGEKVKVLEKLVNQNKDFRQRLLETYVIHLLYPTSFVSLVSVPNIDRLQKDFLKRLLEYRYMIPKNISDQEIMETYQRLEKEGIIRIAPVTSYIFEADQESTKSIERKLSELTNQLTADSKSHQH